MQCIRKQRGADVLWERRAPNCRQLWWRISPTLQCDCRCSYCSTAFRHRSDAKTLHERRRLSPEQWIMICNKLGTRLYILGGEPFLYRGLIDVIEQINFHLRIASNLGPVTDEIIERLCKRGNIYMIASYHHEQPGAIAVEALARKVNMLQASGLQCRVNMVSQGPQYLAQLRRVQSRFKAEFEISARIVGDYRVYNVWPGCQSARPNRTVLCQIGRLQLVGPDGFRYPCQSKLVRGVDQMEDLLTDDPTPAKYSLRCREFGLCLPCDSHGPRKIETVLED